MQIAAEHAKAVSQRAGISVEERLLFNGIALHAADVSPGNIKLSSLIEANFADAGLCVGDGTTVSAGETAHAITIKFFVKLTFANVFVEDLAKGGHCPILPLGGRVNEFNELSVSY